MMNLHLFDTVLGSCGIAWSDKGVVRFELPCGSATKTKARMLKCVPDAVVVSDPPADIARAVKKIQCHLDGGRDDLQDVVVDCSAFTPFTKKVYQALRGVEPGETVTYGELARRAGRAGAARAVGRAMATNPVPLIIPCHRVLPADGSLGNFSSVQGPKLKAHLLTLEGVTRY